MGWLGELVLGDDDEDQGEWGSWEDDDDPGEGAYEGIEGDGGGSAAWGLDPEDQDDEDPDGLGEGDGGDWAGTTRDQRVQQESEDVISVSDEQAADGLETAGYLDDTGEMVAMMDATVSGPVGEWVQAEDGTWTYLEGGQEGSEDYQAAYDEGWQAALLALGNGEEGLETVPVDPDEAEAAETVTEGEGIESIEDADDDQENDEGDEAPDAAGFASSDVCDECGTALEAGATSMYCPVCSS